MRILELGKYYPPHRGGMETVLRRTCLGLSARGHRVQVLVSGDGLRSRSETLEGVEVLRLGRWGQWRSLSLNPGLPWAIRRVVRRFRPQIVHLHLPNPAMAVAWSFLGDRGLPLVISYHSDIVRQRWLGRLLEPLRQRVLTRAAAIVVSSEDLLERSGSLRPHRARCVVIPLGVDVGEVEGESGGGDASDATGLPWTRYYLFVGRMVYYKGLDVLLAALKEEEMPLAVVGDGPLRRRWEALSRRWGLQERVRFLGEVGSDRLDTLYRSCHALVLPSTAPSETFGLVQLEAMARGRPVVAARASGGVASVQEDGVTGLLVPPGDAPALRDALRALWDDPGQAGRMGEAARRRVRTHFDERTSIDRLAALLERAVEVEEER